MIYFDSCYLAKLYLLEPDSVRVREHAAGSSGLVCCAIGCGEVIATLHRHYREARLTRASFRLLAAQVEADVTAGLWGSLPVTPALIESQTRRMAQFPADCFLRATDALHLTCAAEAGLREIYSSDRHLASAASHFGLQAIVL